MDDELVLRQRIRDILSQQIQGGGSKKKGRKRKLSTSQKRRLRQGLVEYNLFKEQMRLTNPFITLDEIKKMWKNRNLYGDIDPSLFYSQQELTPLPDIPLDSIPQPQFPLNEKKIPYNDWFECIEQISKIYNVTLAQAAEFMKRNKLFQHGQCKTGLGIGLVYDPRYAKVVVIQKDSINDLAHILSKSNQDQYHPIYNHKIGDFTLVKTDGNDIRFISYSKDIIPPRFCAKVIDDNSGEKINVCNYGGKTLPFVLKYNPALYHRQINPYTSSSAFYPLRYNVIGKSSKQIFEDANKILNEGIANIETRSLDPVVDKEQLIRYVNKLKAIALRKQDYEHGISESMPSESSIYPSLFDIDIPSEATVTPVIPPSISTKIEPSKEEITIGRKKPIVKKK